MKEEKYFYNILPEQEGMRLDQFLAGEIGRAHV